MVSNKSSMGSCGLIKTLCPPPLLLYFLELERLLSKFGQDSQILEDSVLIGCSEEQEAWFALDLGLNRSSSKNGT